MINFAREVTIHKINGGGGRGFDRAFCIYTQIQTKKAGVIRDDKTSL